MIDDSVFSDNLKLTPVIKNEKHQSLTTDLSVF